MEVKGMWITVNIEKVLPRLSLRSQLRFNPRSVLRSVPRCVSRSVPRSNPRYVLRSVPRSVPSSVPCFILFMIDERKLSSLFWSLLTIIEQVLRHWCHTDAQGLARLSANSSQQYTSLNYYTKRLEFSRRSRTRKQWNWKTENETGEGLFPSPDFEKTDKLTKKTEFAQPTSDFGLQRLVNLVLALQTNAGHLGFQRCSTIIPASWRHNLVKFNP